MKKLTLVLFFILVMVGGNVFAGTPEKDYFDQQFNKLQRSVSEVKGDTSQIVSILGNVFEGTVPAGGTLTKLCNEQGWNLVVLMGHNGIVDPNSVAAGESFTYPQTAEDFQAALRKGKPLYDAWLKNQQTTFRVNRIKVDTAEIDELNVRIATKLRIKQLEIDNLKVLLGAANDCIKDYEARPRVIMYGPGVSIDGDCDERPFTGNVPDAVLIRSPNGADAIEVHERSAKKERFKAKRVRVGANGVANPMVWSKKNTCMHMYSKDMLTAFDLKALLIPGETLVKINEYADKGGKHQTVSVYLIVPAVK